MDEKNIAFTMADAVRFGHKHMVIPKEQKISFGKEMEKALIKLYRKQTKNRRRWG